MSKALKNFGNTSNYRVTEKASDNQVVNNTGGFVFEVSDKSRLERFLILGVDGGTYYVTENDLTKQNVNWLISLIKSDPVLVLNTTLDVSKSGRSYRNSAAIFVFALMLNYAPNDVKSMVASSAHEVARTATMVYELAQYIENLSGWGRSKRTAISNWFTSKTPDQLAFQAVKYRQRNGWTLRDLMRLSHPVGVDQNVGNFILGHAPRMVDKVPSVIDGFITIQASQNVGHVLKALEQYPNLPWETIPTQFLKDPDVWKTLFYNGQLNGQALLRNVTRMARIGAFSDIKFAGDYAKLMVNEEMIRKTRLHPMQYLLAERTYTMGQASRSEAYGSATRNKDWSTNPKIISALNDGFHLAFSNVEKSDKRFRIGVDVSGSMGWGFCAGADLTPAEAAAAMALVTTRVEDYVEVLGFANTLRDLGISGNENLDSALRKTRNMTFGYTNPSLLINDALAHRVEVDTFVVITDNEVNAGTHVFNDLKNYRQKMGIDAKLAVMAMTPTRFTIADPSDRGMLDVVGFDANTPKVISDFAAGRI
jgi:60 kDa SS-A/Ro ribonucleoprotein